MEVVQHIPAQPATVRDIAAVQRLIWLLLYQRKQLSIKLFARNVAFLGHVFEWLAFLLIAPHLLLVVGQLGFHDQTVSLFQLFAYRFASFDQKFFGEFSWAIQLELQFIVFELELTSLVWLVQDKALCLRGGLDFTYHLYCPFPLLRSVDFMEKTQWFLWRFCHSRRKTA